MEVFPPLSVAFMSLKSFEEIRKLKKEFILAVVNPGLLVESRERYLYGMKFVISKIITFCFVVNFNRGSTWRSRRHPSLIPNVEREVKSNRTIITRFWTFSRK